MSKDGLLPADFAQCHPRFKTPWLATILTGFVAMVMAGLFPIGLLGELVSIGTLLAFAIVCIGVMVLRFTDPRFNAVSHPVFWLVCPLGALLLPSYGWSAARHMGAAYRLDGSWIHHLFRLWPPPFSPANRLGVTRLQWPWPQIKRSEATRAASPFHVFYNLVVVMTCAGGFRG